MFQGPTTETPAGHAMRASVTFTLEPGRHRRAEIERLLQELLEQWQLPARADRHAASAAVAIARAEPLELFVQLDRVSQLLTLELWTDGRILYGLDDWVG